MTVEVLILDNGEYVRAGFYGSGDRVVSVVLPDIDIRIDSIFSE